MSEAAKPSSSTSRVVAWGLVIIVAALTVGYLRQAGWFKPPVRVALITSSADTYWDDVIVGAKQAAEMNDVQLTVYAPKTATREEQTEIATQLLKEGIDGIAISPIDPTFQAPVLKDIADNTYLVTFDSDSPVAGRICFVGTDNYETGRRCGEVVREALPEGGTVAIVIGTLEKVNGHRRRQGLIDDLLDRAYNPQRSTDPVEGELSGPKYTVIATLVDKDDPNEAFQNCQALLKEHPDLDCLFGLYSYHAVPLVKAVKAAGLQDSVRVIGFDYNPGTLEALEAGDLYATFAQDSYNYGFTSIRILADLKHGRGTIGVPVYGKIHYPCEVVKQGTVAAFKDRLNWRENNRTSPDK